MSVSFAARVGDFVLCPVVDPKGPHVGAALQGPGCPTVLIGGKPAAVQQDVCVCGGVPNPVRPTGSTVRFGGRPAARLGDLTGHGGPIVTAEMTVILG